MKISKSYKLSEFLDWTRRKLYVVLALAITPVVLYQLMGQKWIALPWSVAVLLGTATSFIVGFKNAQTYNRTVEAQQVWTAIASASRYWGTISRDFPTNPRSTKALIYRHLAWLTVLRYELRGPRVWDGVTSGANAEYRDKFYIVPETESPLEVELAKYLPKDELEQLAAATNKPTRLIGAQSGTIKELFGSQQLSLTHHAEMQRTLKDLIDQQSRAERIKNFPYPRQYATINTIFVWCFAALLPFCVIREFDRLNESVSGLLAGQMAWLAIPFSALVSWSTCRSTRLVKAPKIPSRAERTTFRSPRSVVSSRSSCESCSAKPISRRCCARSTTLFCRPSKSHGRPNPILRALRPRIVESRMPPNTATDCVKTHSEPFD